MKSEISKECCFRGCFEEIEKPDLRIEVYSSEEGSSIFWAHDKCFNARRDPAVLPDEPEDHGSIPSKAKCVYCGMKLPFIGKHSYCFDIGTHSPPQRYWAHNQCMKATIKSEKRDELPF
ncbi:MAG: hypothetical protein ACMUJM_23330 [bacterium]